MVINEDDTLLRLMEVITHTVILNTYLELKTTIREVKFNIYKLGDVTFLNLYLKFYKILF